MNVRDYFLGQRITLRSPLMPDEITRRIREEIGPWWMPFRSGPLGAVRFGRLRLRYRSSFAEYNAKPILIGPLDRTATGTVMSLVYRGPTWARIFHVAWYLFLALFSAILLVAGTDPPLRGAERLMPIGFLIVMAVFPIGLHMFGTRNSDEELEELIEFLERVAEARRENAVLQPLR